MKPNQDSVQFSTLPQNGVIKIPAKYKFLNGNKVKVIVITASGKSNKNHLKKCFGSIKLTEKPLTYQKRMRDEWN